MSRCRGCGRYFKTSGGLRSHQAMVRRTGSHYSRKRGRYTRKRRSYRRPKYRRTYRRRRTKYRRRRY